MTIQMGSQNRQEEAFVASFKMHCKVQVHGNKQTKQNKKLYFS
jgi:hypothetical protein